MLNINLQQKHYTAEENEYQLYLPTNFEVIIPTDDSVRLLSQIVEGMDLSELYMAYSEIGRKPGVKPKIMFKVLVYAYMEKIYSTREIEKACRRDINFMWLLAGEEAPDHCAISRFRQKRLGKAIESLFYQFVKTLSEIGEVKYENVFQDGTKLEATANRYTFVWKKSVATREKKMHEKINEIAMGLNQQYQTNFKIEKASAERDIHDMIMHLERKMAELGYEWVSGAGKRKSSEQKLVEILRKYRERQLGYEENQDILGDRNSYSKTDHDATFMRMIRRIATQSFTDDHMKNGQLKPGYNVQLAVESEYVVGIGVYPNGNDVGTLIPTLETIYKYDPEIRIKNFIADAGFESEENYSYLAGREIIYYIKPQIYEQQQKSSFKKNISKRENMTYNPETDEYTCANVKQLKPIKVTKKKMESGFETETTIYECESCEGCPFKEKCTKSKGNRQLTVSKKFLKQRAQSLENITTEEGILLRINRSIQSEGAFGIIKENRQFTRFLTRGMENVITETLLLGFGYNVNKLHAKIQDSRCGGTGLLIPKSKMAA